MLGRYLPNSVVWADWANTVKLTKSEDQRCVRSYLSLLAAYAHTSFARMRVRCENERGQSLPHKIRTTCVVLFLTIPVGSPPILQSKNSPTELTAHFFRQYLPRTVPPFGPPIRPSFQPFSLPTQLFGPQSDPPPDRPRTVLGDDRSGAPLAPPRSAGVLLRSS